MLFCMFIAPAFFWIALTLWTKWNWNAFVVVCWFVKVVLTNRSTVCLWIPGYYSMVMSCFGEIVSCSFTMDIYHSVSMLSYARCFAKKIENTEFFNFLLCHLCRWHTHTLVHTQVHTVSFVAMHYIVNEKRCIQYFILLCMLIQSFVLFYFIIRHYAFHTA